MAGSADTPVFIGGVNRSGTSMVRQILGSHPDVAIPPTEFEFFKRLPLRAGSRLTNDQINRLVDDILQWPKVAGWELDPALVLDYALRNGGSTRGIFVAFLRAYATRVDKPRFGEKTTDYERELRTFDQWFANDYTFIQVLRHPVPTFASTRWYGGVERPIDPRQWALEWSRSVLIAAQASRSQRSGYLVVRYEDLIRDPERETRRMCHAARVSFREEMLSMVDFAQTENSSFEVGGAQYLGAVRTRDEIDRAAHVPGDQLAVVRSTCRPAAILAGYDVDDEHRLLPLKGVRARATEWRARVSVAVGSRAQFARGLPRRIKRLAEARRFRRKAVGPSMPDGPSRR